MRSVICCVSVLVMSTAFVGCGQSGALHMPNDPNYDKRAKYLLYKDNASKPSTQKEDSTLVKQEFAAPSVETNQP